MRHFKNNRVFISLCRPLLAKNIEEAATNRNPTPAILLRIGLNQLSAFHGGDVYLRFIANHFNAARHHRHGGINRFAINQKTDITTAVQQLPGNLTKATISKVKPARNRVQFKVTFDACAVAFQQRLKYISIQIGTGIGQRQRLIPPPRSARSATFGDSARSKRLGVNSSKTM